MRSLDDVNNEINRLEDESIQICFRGERFSLEYRDLMDKLESLYEERDILLSKMVVSSDIIDIYKGTKKYLRTLYYLTCHNTHELVGVIQVNYSKFIDPIHGNVGYEVKKNYRGNGFALKGLELLSVEMINNGIEECVFLIDRNNTASIKTAMGYGAVLTKRGNDLSGIDRYEVNLKCKVKTKSNG